MIGLIENGMIKKLIRINYIKIKRVSFMKINKYLLLLVLFVLSCISDFNYTINASQNLHGKYCGKHRDYNEFIYFYGENQFYYYVNLCEFSSHVEGSFKINDNEIFCKIKKKGFGEGYGDDLKIDSLLLSLNNNMIKFITPFGCDVSSDKEFSFEETKIKKVKVNNLRLRDIADQKGRIIVSLNKGEQVEVIEIFNKETINSKEGNWVLVRYKETIGYVFNAYLE